MDALKAEIALKRKNVDLGSRPTKYMRRGDIERTKQEEEKAKQERARAVQEKTHKKVEVVSTEQGKSGANVSILPRVIPLLFTCGRKAKAIPVDFPHTRC